MIAKFRALKAWRNRFRECRNPVILAYAFNYEQQRRRLLAFATRQPGQVTDAYIYEIEDDEVFLKEIRARLSQWTPYHPRAVDFMITGNVMDFIKIGRLGSVFFNEVTLYAILRALRPAIVVETGGTPGKSTAFMLRAMERNNSGHLFTIDLPPASIDQAKLNRRESFHELRPIETGSNWIVPDWLRRRHTLLIGRSSELLPGLLDKLGSLDIFFHDSDHSYQNMLWELQTARAKVKPGGLLVSDDVLDNSSFFDFCRHETFEHVNVFNLGIARPTNSAISCYA